MRLLTVLAAAAVMAMPATATTLFSHNFNTTPVANNATSIAGFTITGQVDVIRSGTARVSCAGGIGRCVDLVGSNNPGAILSNAISFDGGRLITVSFDLSGNPRASEVFNFALNFANPKTIGQFELVEGFQGAYGGTGSGLPGFGTYTQTLARNRPFVSYVLSFIPTSGGALLLRFGGSGPSDASGPILDNVAVNSAVIPEPNTWLMLMAGFGFVGLASRRRRTTAAA